MKIYMDVCCLSRPFDDVSQNRVYLEAEAVSRIIFYCKKGRWILMASSIIDMEIGKIPDVDKFLKVVLLYAVAKERIKLTRCILDRAAVFQQSGLRPFDSVHLALAEASGANIFLTTDDRLLRAASGMELHIKIANPVSWLMEVMKDER